MQINTLLGQTAFFYVMFMLFLVDLNVLLLAMVMTTILIIIIIVVMFLIYRNRALVMKHLARLKKPKIKYRFVVTTSIISVPGYCKCENIHFISNYFSTHTGVIKICQKASFLLQFLFQYDDLSKWPAFIEFLCPGYFRKNFISI